MASSSSSDNSAALSTNNQSGDDQEIQLPFGADTADQSAFASPNPTPRPPTGTGAGLMRRDTGIDLNAVDPFNVFSSKNNTGELGTISRPLFIPDKIIQTDGGFKVYTKRAPEDMPLEGEGSSATGGGAGNPKRPHISEDEKKMVHGNATHPPHSSSPRLRYTYYPNPMYPVFDPSCLTIDLPPLPMIPYPPPLPNRDGNPRGEQVEVVEDNLKEHEAQGGGGEVAAASSNESRPAAAVREGVVPEGRRYIVPDLNLLPQPDEDAKDDQDN